MTRRLESFRNMGEELKKLQKENWQKGLAETAKKRVELLPEHEEMHTLPQWWRSLQVKKFQGKEELDRLAKRYLSRTKQGVEQVAGRHLLEREQNQRGVTE